MSFAVVTRTDNLDNLKSLVLPVEDPIADGAIRIGSLNVQEAIPPASGSISFYDGREWVSLDSANIEGNVIGPAISAVGGIVTFANVTGDLLATPFNTTVTAPAIVRIEGSSVVVGSQSNIDPSDGCIYIGLQAGQNVTGERNIGIGPSVLVSPTAATDNVFVGVIAGIAATGSFNTAFGTQSLAIGSGDNNTSIGYFNLVSPDDSSNNVVVGAASLVSPIGGESNVVIGNAAAISNGIRESVAIGLTALSACTIGQNTIIGNGSGALITSGVRNTAIGHDTLSLLLTGNDTTAIGHSALENTTSGQNTAVGNSASLSNTTGGQNVSVGRSALQDNTTASSCTAVGDLSLLRSAANNNSAFGTSAGLFLTAGNNTLAGSAQGTGLTTGTGNTLIGTASAPLLSTGSNNTMVGTTAISIATADNGIALGLSSGITINGQLSVGSALNPITTGATANAGGGAATPATVSRFLHIRLNGQDKRIALYDP